MGTHEEENGRFVLEFRREMKENVGKMLYLCGVTSQLEDLSLGRSGILLNAAMIFPND